MCCFLNKRFLTSSVVVRRFDHSLLAWQADGCTALVMATMLDKTVVVKVLVAAYVARGLGVDHQTVSGTLSAVRLVKMTR